MEAVKTKLQNEYAAAIEVLKDEFFATIKGGPQLEAHADPCRFVAKYFLTTGLLGGIPDRNKPTTPLAVWIKPYNDNSRTKLLKAVEAVPGLAIHPTPDWVLVGWDTELDGALQPHLEKLGGLPVTEGGGIIAQATFDFDRFALQHLHIDVAHNYKVVSSPAECPTTAIIFADPKSFPHYDRLKELATKVPGFHLKEVIPEDDCPGSTVIGWDAAKVGDECRKQAAIWRLITEKSNAMIKAHIERMVAETKAVWERLMKSHRDFVGHKPPRPGPLTTADLVGSYAVVWEGQGGRRWASPHCRSQLYESTLDVFPGESPHGVVASFYFGVMRGTMLLATTRQSVELLLEEQPKRHFLYGDEEESDEEGEAVPRTGQKRQLDSVAGPSDVQAATAKRQKLNPETTTQELISNRAYFQFRCIPAAGYSGIDPDKENIGHFDFDDSKVTAKGQLSLPLSHSDDDPPRPFTLYKISDTPRGLEPMEWYMLDARRRTKW